MANIHLLERSLQRKTLLVNRPKLATIPTQNTLALIIFIDKIPPKYYFCQYVHLRTVCFWNVDLFLSEAEHEHVVLLYHFKSL